MRKQAIRVVMVPAALIAMAMYACLPGCSASARTRTLRAGLVSLAVLLVFQTAP